VGGFTGRLQLGTCGQCLRCSCSDQSYSARCHNKLNLYEIHAHELHLPREEGSTMTAAWSGAARCNVRCVKSRNPAKIAMLCSSFRGAHIRARWSYGKRRQHVINRASQHRTRSAGLTQPSNALNTSVTLLKWPRILLLTHQMMILLLLTP